MSMFLPLNIYTAFYFATFITFILLHSQFCIMVNYKRLHVFTRKTIILKLFL